MTVAAPVVYVVDDDDSFRSATARLLQFAGYRVLEYDSAGAFLLHKAPGDDPGCVLLDLRMPGPSGLELHEALAGMEDRLPVIFVSAHGDVTSSVRAMKFGAVDFLTKPVDRETLLAAVRAAIERDSAHRTSRERRRQLEGRFASLQPRERDVLNLVVAGKLNKEIGAALGIAERTVKVHRAQVMEKMHAGSLAELVLIAAHLKPVRDKSDPAA